MGRWFNVTHRHITFTVADKLWPLLEANPEWRKELFPAANEALRRAIKGIPGIAIVLHPYGKDLKVNYHLHVLVTEGGLNEAGAWQEQTYINYKTLRKVWQDGEGKKIRQEEKWPVLEFIHGVVRLIPPPQFKMVRYYGLYARRSGKKAAEVMAQIGAMRPGKVRRLSWRGRIGREFGRTHCVVPPVGPPIWNCTA